MIKAIVFDFDGLIVDTETIWYEAYKHVLKGYEIDLPLSEFGKVIGTNNGQLFRYIESLSDGKIQEEIIEAAAHEHYYSLMTEPELREGVLDYLEAAKKAGLKIGLASSSRRAWVVGYLKQFKIDHFFETIQTKDDVKNTKPDPELYLRATEALGVKPEEALAFEDSLNGLRAARAAGLHCVIVPNPVTSHSPFTDFSHRLSSMGEITFEEVLNLVEDLKR
jgi:putative hydrolase of the HAD superfamily